MKKFFLLLIVCTFSVFDGMTQDFSEISKILPSDRMAYAKFGWTVSIWENYAIIGAPDMYVINNNDTTKSGAAYIYMRNGYGEWEQIQKIVPADGTNDDAFGATVSIFGNLAIVGAHQDAEDSSGGNPLALAGSAYIFKKDQSGYWYQVQKITSYDRAYGDYFGAAVGIRDSIAVVGSSRDDEDASGSNFEVQAGSAYIYKVDNAGNWNFYQKITASNRMNYANFGSAIAISDSRIVVSARRENNNSGAVHIFQNNSGVWTEEDIISASNSDANDFFGHSVDISKDHIIVGALNPYSMGHAYFFEFNANSGWTETYEALPINVECYSQFGVAVAISDSCALVGAWYDDYGSISQVGSVSVFKLDNFGSWNLVQKFYASDLSLGDKFGCDVDISGPFCVVGAYVDKDDVTTVNPLNDAGSAYIFESPFEGASDSSMDIVVYPNPNDGKFKVVLGQDMKNIYVKVHDYKGRLVLEEYYPEANEIDIRLNVADGIYFADIISSEKSLPHFKILKQ